MKHLLFIATLLLAGSVFAEGEAFEPTTPQSLDKLYSAKKRSVSVQIRTAEKLHAVSPGFLGINLSYFNTTDEIWTRYDLLDKLKSAGVGALRYPGGEETSFFHWKHPGVNGYEDLWGDPSQHGNSPGRGRFQTTWVDPSAWATNETFMNFDEFMANCTALGAEPIVGINLSSGKKHNRRADGIAEALEWMRYCKEKGYKVENWFLDNEPWHFEAAHTFTLEEYAEEVLAYGTAIKNEFPDAKLIVNPASASNLYPEQIQKFIRLTGPVVDYIDVHWYWGWGKASLEHWAHNTPLNTDDRWKKPDQIRTYAEDILLIRNACARAGFPNIGIMALEWNIAPSDYSQTFNQSLRAVIQAELLLEFAKSDVRLTCLWPLIWQTSRDVWSEQDTFHSIVTSDPPFNPTLSLDMFRMLSALQGKTLLKTESPSSDVVVLAAENPDETVFYLISKSVLRRKVSVGCDFPITGKTSAEMIGLKHEVVQTPSIQVKTNSFSFFAEPYSLTAIRIEK